MKTCVAVLVLLSAALAAAPVLGADQAKPDAKTQAAIDQIAAKTAGVKSFAADFSMAAAALEAELGGRFTFLLPDKIHMTMTNPFGMNQTTISDGKTLWALIPAMKVITKIDMAELKKALKELGLPAQQQQHNIARPFDAMKDGSARLVGDEKLGQTECWVFEGALNVGANAPAATRNLKTLEVCVAKSDGLARRISFTDDAGESRMLLTYKNVEVNPDVKPALFDYTPPEGAAVMDHTQQVIMMMKQLVPKKK
ncbi:MAG: DUF2092 domain-containing protein [Planctomycetota bacterium]